MRTIRRAAAVALGLFLAQAAAASIFEQSYIYPERAGKNKVRWRNYDWQYVDLLTEEDGQGGVRLYYYDREKEAAELAAAAITEEYKHLKQTFGIVPDIRMPYVLYASHLEFEEQNLFDISESILGVTSTQDLTLSLPYWGEHQRFVEVSRHEMAHQFTIQKAYQIQRLHRTRQNPLERIPLWFIEGLAEYSAHRGLHEEVPMYVADVMLNPEDDRQHKLFPFWHDEVRNFVQTYRMGQVRVAYLAERYGERVVQDVLGKSYTMLQRPDMQPTDQILGFQSFLEELTSMKPKPLDEDYKNWLRKEFDIERLEKTEEAPKLEEQKAVSDTMDSYTILQDGFLVLYRDVDITTANTRLRLVDLRDEDSRTSVAEEGKPGIESLHFFQRRVFALSDGLLAYAALHKERDILYLQSFEREVEQRGEEARVRIRLGEKRPVELKTVELYEAGDLAFSPDGKRMAFVGLTPDGRADVYIADLTATDIAASIRRVTNDFFSERMLSWGKDGVLLASDRTPKGYFNLFLLDPDGGGLRQITDQEANHDAPTYGLDGSILFTSHQSGKSNVYRLTPVKLERLTDTHTGLFEPREVPGGLLVRKFFRGRFRLYKASSADLKAIETHPLGVTQETSLASAVPSPQHLAGVLPGGRDWERIPMSQAKEAFARLPLAQGEDYKSGDLSNWRLDVGGAGLSTDAYGGLYLAFSDRMRDQSVIFDVAINGDFRYTDANVFYINRKRQLGWGLGVLHNLRIRRDRRDTTNSQFGEPYLQRDFGAYAIAQYPFDRFTHVQLGVGVLGVARDDYPGRNTLAGDIEGIDTELELSLSGGYDTVGYQYVTGPVSGLSLFGKLDYSFIPDHGGLSLFSARSDLQHFTHIWKGVNLMTRVAFGMSFGDRRFRQQYYISSYDNLRGLEFGDGRLLGYQFAVGNLELQLPLSSFFEKPAITQLFEGVIGFDIGSVFDDLNPPGGGFLADLPDHRVANFVLGTNFLLGPFVMRLHFAKPLDIGGVYSGPCTSFADQMCLPNQGDWQTNFSIRWAFM
jgi:hypothetical protein